MDLNGKCVLLGVSGGIAAYKMANVASALRKLGADVEVIMTKNATQFITPITFETLTGHKCMVDTFDRDFKFEVTHISLAKKADVILVAPATANFIAKAACGLADGDRVQVKLDGPKPGVMGGVLIRANDKCALDFHIDTDDGNAFLLKQGQLVTVLGKEE